ncbi:MFS transporter [Candidatus Woesearchaeota archaeon]|nr:MFS transporter [Candidatus Woesearchaeota archaeon]
MKRGLKLLILSDLFILMGFGLVAPIISIFINESLIGGSIAAAGLATTIFLITKSIFEIPFGKIEDHASKKLYLIIGSFIIAFTPLGYFLMKTTMHLYILQFFYGLGAAMAYPAYFVLFTHFIDRGKEAFDWSVYGSVVGVGAAITAAVGGYFAETFSFSSLFLFTFFICLAGSFLLFFIPKEHFKKKNRKQVL